MAIYTGAGRIEGDMRPEAKKDMAAFLRTKRLSHDWKVYHRFIRTVFVLLFGERHLSIKCFFRSLLMTVSYISALSVLFYFKNGAIFPTLVTAFVQGTPQATDMVVLIPLAVFVFTMLFSVIPDYLSLAKGRAILNRVEKVNKFRYVPLFIALDLLLSFLISMSLIVFYGYVLRVFYSHSPWLWWADVKGIFLSIVQDFEIAFTFPRTASASGSQISALKFSEAVLMSTYITSTMLTSLWALAFLISCVFIKIAAPFEFTLKVAVWFYDIDEHPVKALGSVFAALIWVGSIIYGLV